MPTYRLTDGYGTVRAVFSAADDHAAQRNARKAAWPSRSRGSERDLQQVTFLLDRGMDERWRPLLAWVLRAPD